MTGWKMDKEDAVNSVCATRKLGHIERNVRYRERQENTHGVKMSPRTPAVQLE